MTRRALLVGVLLVGGCGDAPAPPPVAPPPAVPSPGRPAGEVSPNSRRAHDEGDAGAAPVPGYSYGFPGVPGTGTHYHLLVPDEGAPRAALAGGTTDRSIALRVYRAGRVVEGHGDLRPEHVWLGSPPAIIDCLEFSLALRTLDSADELGFLALECERLGAPELGAALLAQHRELSGDAPPPALVDLYQAMRACVRAGIALWHLKEARYQGSPVWRARATSYLSLAAARLQRCGGGAACQVPAAPAGAS